MRCLELIIGLVTTLSCCNQTCFVDSARVVSLDEELKNLSSHSILLLNDSVLYNVTDFHIIVNLINVTINGPADITCSYGVGLVFINITGLTFNDITIQECGLTGDNLTIVNRIIHHKVANTSYHFRSGIKVAIFVIGSINFTLNNVTVTKTQGIGMVCVNVLGLVTFTDVMFQRNRPASIDECYKCLFPFVFSDDQCAFNPFSVSGSLFLLYVDNRDGYPRLDANVNIHRGTFVDNLSCSVTNILNIDAVQFPSLSITDRNATATGGIKLILGQGSYYVDVRIVASSFKNNRAFLGSAMSIDIFYDASSSNVSIENSVFLQNSMPFDLFNNIVTYGGSISVVANIRPFQVAVLSSKTKHIITIKDCNFTGNSAVFGGAISFRDILSSNFYAHISQCKFEKNLGYSGSCIATSGILESSTAIMLEECLFRNNSVNDTSQSFYGTVIFDRIATKIRNTKFSHNIGTAVSLSASLLVMDGNVEFQENTAFIGGALNLQSDSRILVSRNSDILFENNQALYIGGAIHMQFVKDEFCPIYFNTYDPYCLLTKTCYSKNYNISVSFINNTAILGSAVFGYILGCPWLYQAGFNITTDDAFQFIETNFNETLKFIPSITGNDSVITSDSVMITSNPANITAIPGQVTTILLSSINYYNRSTVSLVSTNSLTQGALASQDYSAELENTGFQLVHDNTPTAIQVYGSEASNVTVIIYSSHSHAQLELPVQFIPCPPFGFSYNNENKSCECDSVLQHHGVTCNFTSGRLNRPKNKWMGDVSGEVVVLTCVQNYCSGKRSIDPVDLDDQCVDYRGGVLCGGCRQGYSAHVDLSGCTSTCSGLFIWLAYIVFGALILLIAIVVLHMYVSDGYLYGTIFYSNVLYTFRNAFFHRSHVLYDVITLRFQDCLYEGMSFLVAGALQFILPAYTFLLMGALTLITKKFNSVNRRFSFSFTKASATLLYLTYSYLLNISFTILVSRQIKTSLGTDVRWRTDPNVKYFHGWHGLLGAVSILVLLALTLVALVLLFPGVAYRFKVIQKLKPIMDAFQAPFKLQYYFWIGLQLIVQIILNVLLIAVPEHYQLYCVGLIISVLLYVQTFALPYKELANSWNLRNYLESLFLLFLLVHIIEVESTDVLVVSVICFSIYLMILVGIVIYYILLRFPRLKQLVHCGPCKKKQETVDTNYTASINKAVDDTELAFSKSLRTDYPDVSRTDIAVSEEGILQAVNYAEFREPLLEDDYS